MSSTVIFWTELSCWRKSYSNKATLLIGWYHRYPGFLVGSVLLIFLVFCVVLLCVFTFWVSCCDVRNDFRIKTKFGLCLQLFVRGLMSYLRYLCLLACSGVQHILCCVFVFFFFVLCTLCCQFLWVVFVLFFFVLCTLCCQFLWIVFVLFFFVLCTLCCQFLWIVLFWLPLRYSLTWFN